MKSLKNLTTILFLTAGITFFSGNTFSQDSSQIKSHAQIVKEGQELTERINKTLAKYEVDDLESDAYLKYLDKDYDGAIQKYLEYLKLRPKDAEAYDNLAECYSAIGQSKKAIEYYSKSTNLNPDAFIYHKIAGQYEKLNSLEEAHKNLDKAISIDPKEDLYYRYKELLYQIEFILKDKGVAGLLIQKPEPLLKILNEKHKSLKLQSSEKIVIGELEYNYLIIEKTSLSQHA